MKTNLFSPLWVMANLAAALLLVQTAVATVTVYGLATCNGPTITVNLFADVTNAPLISFGVQLGYDPTVLQLKNATNNPAVWYFSDGTNLISYMGPDVSTPGSVVIIGGKLDGLTPLQGVMGQHVLLGTVNFSRLTQMPVLFTLGFGRPQPFANFVTPAGEVLDPEPGGVAFPGVTNDPNDTNLDGLPDAWEIAHFGSISAYTWSDDPDHDGFNNLQEYLADTDPLDSNSYLHMTGASIAGPGRLVKWKGGVQSTQYLERSFALRGSNTIWVDIITNLPPTVMSGSYTDSFSYSNEIFYRLKATR